MYHHPVNKKDVEHNENYHYFPLEENPTIPDDQIHFLKKNIKYLLKFSSYILPSKLSQPSPPNAYVNNRIILCRAKPRSTVGVRSAKTDICE